MPHHSIGEFEIEKMMDLLVSLHCQCRGIKFYGLRSAGVAWGTKLDLSRNQRTPMIHCVSRLRSLGYLVREAKELDLVCLAMLQRR